MEKKKKNIGHAFWETEHCGVVILTRSWESSVSVPPLTRGPVNQKFRKIEAISASESGRFFCYYKSKQNWVFMIRSERYPQLLDKKTKVYLSGEFNGWTDAIGKTEWRLKPAKNSQGLVYELRVPTKVLPEEKTAAFKFVTDSVDWLDVPDTAPNLICDPSGATNFVFDPNLTGKQLFRFYLPEGYELVGNERVVWTDANGEEAHELPHTQDLTSASTDHELGAFVDGDRTTFRLFAPRAECVSVVFSNKADGSDASTVDLKCVDGVTWEAVIAKNLDGWFYSYRVGGKNTEGTSHFDATFPILDPYAKACIGPQGPGIVVAPERMPKVAEPFQPPAWHDLVIMEGHVRDLVAHAPIKLTEQERKGYTGLSKWLKGKGSYLREMGVNAIELQPIQEFDNRNADDYHWGYMTVNYFSPDSSYASEPERASQIEEFRQLVKDFHDEGMAVIVDVVYNHVGEPNHLLFIDKYYYFNLDQTNGLMNWSGCGNDLRCETPMGRHLIIESLKHLVEVYDVDGFRFDLAELIGIEVLREIEIELKKIKPSLILIAEPWSFRGHIQDELRETGFASWNDGFRECIADYVCGKGNQDTIKYFLSGSPSSSRFAAQTINYTESHDDHCWMDRITQRTGRNGSDPTSLDRRRTHLMAAILFTSLGVPMLAEGQDFLRSKNGISNTYQKGDVNALDYNRRYVFSGTHGYFRDWIEFRLSELGRPLRFDGGLTEGYLAFYFTEGSSAVVMVVNADQSRPGGQLVFAVNPHLEYADINCKRFVEMDLLQIADQERFERSGLRSAKIPITDRGIHIPPLSCGLWLVK